MKLIIGSNGFLGKSLCNRFKKSGDEFICMNSESAGVLNPSNFQRLNDSEISHVYHLGSKTYVPDSWEHPADFLQVISEGTLNVLKFCHLKKVPLTFVSAYIYGNQVDQPIKENTQPSKSNPYAHSKLIAEKYCEFYRDFMDLKVNILRPFNIYGPSQDNKFFIPSLLNQALTKPTVKLENVITKRDFIFSEDVTDALIASEHFIENGSTYNVGSGISYSIEDIIQIIGEKIGKKLIIETENNIRKNEILNTVASVEKIKNDLGWYSKHTIHQGLELTIKDAMASSEEKCF